MLRLTFLLAALLLAPAGARAAWLTGAELLQACADPDGAGQIYCLGYVTAIADVLEHNDVNGLRACIPEDAPAGALAGIVRESLQHHPERGGYGAGGLVADALRAAFPCP